jgi:putative transposase
MTLPKRRLPGTAYFLSPVCDRHEFRLKPTPETKAAFAFTIVEAASRHGVDLIAVMQMSSHYHAVVYDRLGRLSEFLRDFHGVMGRFGSWRDGVENTKFWSAQESEAVEIGDMDTLVECTAYTLANPTNGFIVERPEQWVGVMTPVDSLGSGRGQVFFRPMSFFDPDGMTSEGVMLCSDYPHELEELLPHETFRERVKARVEDHIATAHAEVAAGRRSFSGLEHAKKLSVWHSARTWLSGKVGHRVEPRRRVAAATQGRIQAMLEELLAFRRAHRTAWEAMSRGVRDVLFPAGTWFAWRFYGAQRIPAINMTLEAPS